MEVSALLIYMLPVISLVVVVVFFMNMKMQSLARRYEDYKSDEFRQSIEKQIAELAKELTVNKHRFDSVNHLLIDAQNPNFSGEIAHHKWGRGSSADFFKSIGVRTSEPVDETLAFVLTPFNEKYNSQYSVIKQVVTDLGFRCSRGDDSNLSSNILGHIVQQITKSRIVIANISGRNPNVFYELGIAHALGKPVLIVSESLADIPFDINSSRILAFEDENDLSKKLRNWFVHTLASTHNNASQ
jgi:hypothetical protein